MMNLSREDLVNDSLTCPACRISTSVSRFRTMCPFCGSFYDPASELDFELRGSHHLSPTSSATFRDTLQTSIAEEHLGVRLPRIGNIQRLPAFGPLIADGLEAIHSYLTGLLFHSSTHRHFDGHREADLFMTLPPIDTSHHRSSLTVDHEPIGNCDSITSGRKLSPRHEVTLGDNNHGRHLSNHTNDVEEEVNYPERSKSVEELRKDVEDATKSGDYSSIHDFYLQTFSSPLELLALMKLFPEKSSAKIDDPELKIELLNELHDHLNDLPSFIGKSVLKGIINCLTKQCTLKMKDEARFLFILIQNPLFGGQSSYTVFAHLMKRIVTLASPDHQLFIHWFTKLDCVRFKMLVKRLLQFITIREFPPANIHKLPPLNKSRWWIPSATRVLALLHAANNKKVPNIINYTEFYNSALDHVDLMSEYYKWQNPNKNSKFSYCQYPFILSIVAKKIVIQRDSEQQMILNARRCLLNRALHRNLLDVDVFFLNLNVRRSHLVTDSLQEIAKKEAELKKKLKVTFVGEPGLDMGGLTKEWFLLLIKQIFHDDYGMFVYHQQSRCYWFSTSNQGNLREYNLIGVLMGLAVYNGIILDLHFPTFGYKKLLSPPVVPVDSNETIGIAKVTLDDFAQVMPDVAIGLRQLLSYEGNVEDDFCMNFQVSVEEFNSVQTHPLKANGENIPVTNENREEYVELYMDLIMNKAIFHAFKAFYLGFQSVCASNALIILRPEEVEMLVCGSPMIDMDELRKVTSYDGFSENDPLIREFWSIIKSLSPELQKAFLRFTTGSDRIPVGGMSEMTLKISAINYNYEMLPISHTCFNQLVLPRYKDRSTLREKLVIAISNAEGFGLE